MTELSKVSGAPTPIQVRKGLFGRIRAWTRRLLEKRNRNSPSQSMPGPGERARIDFRTNMSRMIERIEAAIAAGGDREASTIIQWFKSHKKTMDTLFWHEDGDQAKVAHFVNAIDEQVACANYHAYLIEKSVEFSYLAWPRRIGQYIYGKSVLDIGCGFGAFGNAFFAGGAKSYTGLDPQMPLDSATVKNKRTQRKADLGMSPREIMAACPNIRLMNCKFEELEGRERFEVITLHNVTEHLLGIREILPNLKNLLTDDGLLIFHHHNFYCWNGHHMPPKQPEQYDENSLDHIQFADWNHILIAPDVAKDHYFNRNLNQIRLDEINQITKDNFDIMVWDEVHSPPSSVARLNDDIVAKIQIFDPTLTQRDLLVNAAFCVAKMK